MSDSHKQETAPTLDQILIAQPSHIGPGQAPTGIVKVPIEGKVAITELGLEGDFQGDSRVHGGIEKAVYQYPSENYLTLTEALPHLKDQFSKPCLGENFATSGMTDDSVYIGDVYKLGTATLQVSQPRMPCWKVNQHIGNAHMMQLLIALNRSGWYYRVLEEGSVEQGDTFQLEERIQEGFTVQAIWERWVELRENNQQVAPVIDIPGLSTQWSFNWG